jgi:hypothetical protein
VLVYDCVATRNGEPDRWFGLRAQQRGAAHSWVYAQRYGVPQRGETFAFSGELTLVRQRESLFPQLY